MIFIGYEWNTKGYCFWSQQCQQVFISTRAIFSEQVFPYCSRGKKDGPAPIPVEEQNPQAKDNSSQDDDQLLFQLKNEIHKQRITLHKMTINGDRPPIEIEQHLQQGLDPI